MKPCYAWKVNEIHPLTIPRQPSHKWAHMHRQLPIMRTRRVFATMSYRALCNTQTHHLFVTMPYRVLRSALSRRIQNSETPASATRSRSASRAARSSAAWSVSVSK